MNPDVNHFNFEQLQNNGSPDVDFMKMISDIEVTSPAADGREDSRDSFVSIPQPSIMPAASGASAAANSPEENNTLYQGETEILESPAPTPLQIKNSEQDEEIERLKLHLLQLDEEIGKAVLEREATISSLHEQLSQKDGQIAALQSRLREATIKQNDAAHNEDLLNQLKTDNIKLKEVLEEMRTDLREKNETIANLQTALNMLQNTMRNEIDGTAVKLKTKISELEKDLIAKEAIHAKLLEDMNSFNDLEVLKKKLVKDLDYRNILIDQLNDEINGLKKRLEKREAAVDKLYIRSLIYKLLKPPANVERSQIWNLLAFALDLSQEEHGDLITTVQIEGGDALIRQGITDDWIEGLNQEEASQPKAMRSSLTQEKLFSPASPPLKESKSEDAEVASVGMGPPRSPKGKEPIVVEDAEETEADLL